MRRFVATLLLALWPALASAQITQSQVQAAITNLPQGGNVSVANLQATLTLMNQASFQGLNGLVAVSNTPVTGNIIVATSTTTAAWTNIYAGTTPWTAVQNFNLGFGLSTKLAVTPSPFTVGSYAYPPALATNATNAFNLYAPMWGVYAEGNFNGVLGYVVSNVNAAVEPAGANGVGVLSISGGQVFGVFGAAWNGSATNCPVAGGGTSLCSPNGLNVYTPVAGTITNEFDVFNNFGACTGNCGVLPPNRAPGGVTALPIDLTVACGGAFQCAIGMQIAQAGNAPNSFLTGVYMNPNAAASYGIFIDATNTADDHSYNTGFGPATGVVIRNRGQGAGSNLVLQTVGTFQAFNAVLLVEDASTNVNFSVFQNGSIELGRSGANAGTILMDGATSGRIQLVPPAVAGAAVLTFPGTTDTLVGRATTDTLTNKTLTTPVIPGLPASAGAGGLFICVDNVGVIYKKATCP